MKAGLQFTRFLRDKYAVPHYYQNTLRPKEESQISKRRLFVWMLVCTNKTLDSRRDVNRHEQLPKKCDDSARFEFS